MKVRDIVEIFGLKVFSGERGLGKEVSHGYTSDLLSDVIGYAQKDSIWITLHTNKNIMAVAVHKELSAIILVKNFEPEQDTMDISNEEGLPILGTSEEAFNISGKIYQIMER